MVSKTWKENFETFCIGLNWERFSDLDHALVNNIFFLKWILQELDTFHCSTFSLPYICSVCRPYFRAWCPAWKAKYFLVSLSEW